MGHAKSNDPNVFLLPDLGEGLAEAELIKWRVTVGQAVGELEVLAEMETDKALVEVTSPRSGTIAELHGEPGQVIKVGTPLVVYGGGAAAKKPAPAAPVEPEQPQLAREPAAPQTPLEKELHRLYYDFKFYVGRDKLYWLMQQQQQKAAAAGREFPYFSHRLIQSWLSKQELSRLFRPIRNPIKSRSTTASAPFKQIAMVLTSLFSNETDQRFKRILTAIDLFTKKGWAVPMTNKDTASIHAALQLQGEFWIVGVKFVLAA
jgi:hypothetical protein